MSSAVVTVTLAILYQQGQFLMQLRDDFPHIVHPGIWGFFGGHLDPGETPEAGLRRELLEEIGYAPPALTLFEHHLIAQKARYYYYAPLTVPLGELRLAEGQDLALCSIDEIRAGHKYSSALQEVRSLGQPHQQMLLKFYESGLMAS
jgi:8-oxo-dGTP diphosphatase